MRQFISKNPTNNKLLAEFKFTTSEQLNASILKSQESYQRYKNAGFKEKSQKLIKLSELVDNYVDKYAKLISIEMGKPYQQAWAEVKKSAAYCRHYAENGDKYMRQERVKTEAHHSYVKYEPIGPIYVIGPFNFPFWLCFKPIIPQLTLGNTILYRTSDSTGLLGLALEELFKEAGFDSNEFQTVFSSPDQLNEIIGHNAIQGVSFTGSSRAGSIIGSAASKYLKRSVLELGGSDPFCVMKECDLELAVNLAIKSRIANCGQVCFSAKRFIVHELHYDKFRDRLVKALSKVKVGDPLSEDTEMGPMARYDLVTGLHAQIQRGIKDGGKLVLGGQLIGENEADGNYYPATVVEVKGDNILAQEETFGPLFTLIKAGDNQEIIRLANRTSFGLGAVVISQDQEQIQQHIDQLECGMVFVNEVVKSDARLPSGGIKNSGYGRECGYWGMNSFVNVKTVWIQ